MITRLGQQNFKALTNKQGMLPLRTRRHRQIQKEGAEEEGNLEAGNEIPPTPRADEREATEDKDDFWSMSGDSVYRQQTWTSWRRATSPIEVTSTATQPSEDCFGFTRFQLSLKRPPQGNSWVSGRLTEDQRTTRPSAVRMFDDNVRQG